jgi:hypothetical protein
MKCKDTQAAAAALTSLGEWFRSPSVYLFQTKLIRKGTWVLELSYAAEIIVIGTLI